MAFLSNFIYFDDPEIEDDETKFKEPTPKPTKNPDVWANHFEYVMAGVAAAIGLGNVWRFPFVAFQNGGGAFLIPYLVVLLLVARPMYYAESFIGQFAHKNYVSMWSSMSPIMTGTGYASALASGYVVSYYSAITSLCIFYLGKSFQTDLPWAHCDEEWGDYPPCVPSIQIKNVSYKNGTRKSSAELYFTKTVLHETQGLENGIGTPRWYLVLCLFIVWLIVFLVVSQGVRSHGKAAYFLAISPYVMMVVLLISTLTLKGSLTGISFFFTPKWSKILQIEVWYAATTQVFFSFGISVPSNVGTATSHDFTVDFNKDALMMTILDALSGILSGVVIFGILGNLSFILQRDMQKVVGRADLGLFFVTYPDAVMKTPVPQAFAIVFFLMVSIIGVSTSVKYFTAIINAVKDSYPDFKRSMAVPAVLSVAFFFISLVYVTPSGQFIISLVDYYGGGFLVLACCFAECIGIFWSYGIEYFCLDIEFTLDKKVSLYWRITWGLLIPALMLVMFVYAIVTYHQLKHGGSYIYPIDAYVSGNLMVAVGVIMIPAYFIYYAFLLSRQKKISFLNAIHEGTYFKDQWGPVDPSRNEEWKEFVAATGMIRAKRSFLNHMIFIFTGRYKIDESEKIALE